ncbi:MAG: DUF1707 domain-containing protein [Trebonia sp.]|jgi:hypothetical protein|uniref:DUF1707 SHOCT-like domain-containing protein n=1 Tax=Trebonia sp. TaxID=2767075 RepID=UPI003BB07F74
MAAGNEMRVGDAEREAAAAELREHYASGRLTLDELNERVDKAFAATTRGDLNALMTDLPSARPGWSSAGASGPSGSSALPPGAPGAGGPFGPGGSGWNSGPRAAGPMRTAGSVLVTMLVVAALFLVGTLGAFGIGAGRPFGIVLILAAFGLLRRLFFRRRVGGCGPRRRGRW